MQEQIQPSIDRSYITCWICRARIADTREHRMKRTDLSRFFSAASYVGDERPYHIRGHEVKRLQSNDSKYVKYERNICGTCNSTFSQPFDRAYEKFTDWILQNESVVVQRQTIDFEDVFESDWDEQQRNLFKYFAKCLGCRINEARRKVPNDLRDLLQLQTFVTEFSVSFSVRGQLRHEGVRVDLTDSVGTAALLEYPLATGSESLTGYSCGQHVSWLETHFWYCLEPEFPYGEKWIANRKSLRLGLRES
jgi:hypothetical protein